MRIHPSLRAYSTDLTDKQWRRLRHFFPVSKGPGRPPKHDRRHLLNAILYLTKAGCPWRLLPHDFAPWKTVYHYYRLWSGSGLWEVILRRLRAAVRQAAGKRPAPTVGILDSQTLKHESAREDIGYDGAKQIKGRKRHLLVDTLGLLLAVRVTGADVQDRDGARRLLSGAVLLLGRLQLLWADGAYKGALVDWVKSLRPWGRLRLDIVSRPPQAKGFRLLPKRWIVERTFGWLMRSRRLVRDYERRTSHSEAFIELAMIAIMLRRLDRHGSK
jgi:putative transposase